jgi:hypothetical protein
VSEFHENTLKTVGSMQAASRGEARCHFVSTYSRAVSIEQDAKATLTVRYRSAQEMGTDTLVSFSYHIFNIQCTSGQQYNFTREKQCNYNTHRHEHTIYKSAGDDSLLACREHFRGGVPKSFASSLRGSPWLHRAINLRSAHLHRSRRSTEDTPYL